MTRSSLAAALPDLTFGVVCLAAWFWADRLPPWMLNYIVLTMLLEFIVIHSAAFLGSVAFSDQPEHQKRKTTIGLGSMYSLFVLGFSLAFKTIWPLFGFWGQTLNRLMVAPGMPEQQRRYIQGMWGITVALYLAGAFLSSLMPWPRLGVTYEIVSAANLPGEGLWIDQPWRPVVFGFFYFTSVGLFELFQERWLKHVPALKAQFTQS